MSSYSTLCIHADDATRRALVALRPALQARVREAGFADAVVDDFIEAFAKGEGAPSLPAPATRELVEWIHAQHPGLVFAADVGDEPDGDFGDWAANYGLEVADSPAGPTMEQVQRWMRIVATLIAAAAVAFAAYRIRQAGF